MNSHLRDGLKRAWTMGIVLVVPFLYFFDEILTVALVEALALPVFFFLSQPAAGSDPQDAGSGPKKPRWRLCFGPDPQGRWINDTLKFRRL